MEIFIVDTREKAGRRNSIKGLFDFQTSHNHRLKTMSALDD